MAFSEIFTNASTIVTLILFATVIAYIKWSFNYWKTKGVRTPPIIFPFGNMKSFILRRTSLGVNIKHIYLQCKAASLRYAGFYFASIPVFLLIDPELIKAVMCKDFKRFVNHGGYVNEKLDPLSGHLFSLKDLKWKTIRTKLTPTFTSGKIKMMFQALTDCSGELVNVMNKASENKEIVDIKDVMARFTTDVIGSCGFGIECNSLKNPESKFRQYGKRIFRTDFSLGMKMMLGMCIPRLLAFIRIVPTPKDVSRFFINVVSETIRYREENNIERKDFMHLLMQLKNNNQLYDENHNEKKHDIETDNVIKPLTILEIAAQAFSFFVGGFETSSTTLTFCFYELAKNVDIQEKLRKEVKSVLEKNDGKLTYDTIMEMTYMDKCVNETLRKYPAVPILTRECNKAYKIPESDLTIEPGTLVFISTLGLHHDPENYPDPKRFDPERFSPENKSTRHPFTWLPFGEGPRVCLGFKFGIIQMKVALAVMLSNFKFTINSKTEEPLVMNPRCFTLSAKKNVWLNAEKVIN